jgi:DNA-binding transcriptional ArsR family regulator
LRQLGDFVQEHIAAQAVSHPLRRQILDALAKGAMSPNQLAQDLGQPLSNVAYHVRKLADLGAVTLVDSRPVRGALEHFYRRAWVIDIRYREDTSKKSATINGR